MEKESIGQRRSFLKKAAALGALATVAPASLPAISPVLPKGGGDGKGFTFLFQGDSITDGNRSRNTDWNHVMGHGYAYLIASRLWHDHPKASFQFYNRGISGNKVPDLMARWQADALDLKPDLVSILIGINDTAAFVQGDQKFTATEFENRYRTLLRQTKSQLPNVQLVLGEPFMLPGSRVQENYDMYTREVKRKREIVRSLCKEENGILVEFQNAFDQALAKAPADYWIWDGVHPMPAGHELMAREWLKQVSRKLTFLKS